MYYGFRIKSGMTNVLWIPGQARNDKEGQARNDKEGQARNDKEGQARNDKCRMDPGSSPE
jgi:hypothetical protein